MAGTRANKIKARTLTERRRQVLQCIAEGLSSKAIAARLGITKKTADGHRTTLIEIAGAANSAALVAYGFRQGLLS